MNQELLFQTLLNNIEDGVYFVDRDRRIILWNHAAEKITGYSKKEVEGHQCQHSLPTHTDANGRPLCFIGCPLAASMDDRQPRKENVFLRHKTGYRVPLAVHTFPVILGNVVVGGMQTFRVKSAHIHEDAFLESLTNQAMTDSLTGLPNRAHMESYLEFKLQELKRKNRKFCVLFADIDNFSLLNDRYGHQAGDAVLQNIAKIFRKNISISSKLGRWGGEEFLGVFDLHDQTEAYIVAEKVRIWVARCSTEYNGIPLPVTVSVGASIALATDTIETVVARADKLMYKSKARSKNCVTVDTLPPKNTSFAPTTLGKQNNK